MSKSQKNKNMAKSKGKTIAAPTTATDLTLNLIDEGTRLEFEVSPNAQWVAIQKFVDPTSNDGAESIHESMRSFYTPPGAGVKTGCSVQGAGHYRGFCSDFDYNVHLSNWVVVP